MTMNLRPSNLEQGRRPVAVTRDAIVSDQDAFRPMPAVPGARRVRPRSGIMLVAFVLSGALTVMWGGLLMWLIFKAFTLTIG
jgi:hypothetical protein